jgi:hypothetical protein
MPGAQSSLGAVFHGDWQHARVDLRDVARLRLSTQGLSDTAFASAEEVVGWLGCVQSQDHAPGKWSVGQRAFSVHDVDLDAALAEGRILRTHILRPTWHFVLPADIRWIQGVTAPRVHVQNRHWLRRAGLDAVTLRLALNMLASALTGRRLTRPQLRATLEGAGIATDGQRMGYILMQAELDLLITSGGLQGKQQTYALLDEVAPVHSEPIAGDQALAELTRRYFTSHGPATVADFTWWSSLTVAAARRGLAALGSEVEGREIEGNEYWAAADGGFDVPKDRPSPRAHFTQGLDEYFVGYQRTRNAADVAGLGLQPDGFADGFYQTLIIDGQLAGAVRRVPEKSGGVTFQTRLMRSLAGDEEAEMHGAASRYAAFLGAPAAITLVD